MPSSNDAKIPSNLITDTERRAIRAKWEKQALAHKEAQAIRTKALMAKFGITFSMPKKI
jgi:hypothetical protein